MIKQRIALLAVLVCCQEALFAQEPMGPPKPSVMPPSTSVVPGSEPMEEVEEAKGFLGGYSVAPANMVIMAKYPTFEKQALSVINKDRDLRRLIRERDAVEARYENLRQIEFGGEPAKPDERK